MRTKILCSIFSSFLILVMLRTLLLLCAMTVVCSATTSSSSPSFSQQQQQQIDRLSEWFASGTFRDSFERQPLHAPRLLQNLVADLNMERILSRGISKRVVVDGTLSNINNKKGQTIPFDDVKSLMGTVQLDHDISVYGNSQRVDKDFISHSFSPHNMPPDNTTLVLLDADGFDRRLDKITRSCEAATRCPCGVSVYTTSPRAVSVVPVHYDTMDVIAVQVKGKKRWSIFTPAVVELPRAEQTMEIDPSVHFRKKKETTTQRIDYDLVPGDVLYIPRGVAHNTTCVGHDNVCVHESYGIECAPEMLWESYLMHTIVVGDAGEEIRTNPFLISLIDALGATSPTYRRSFVRVLFTEDGEASMKIFFSDVRDLLVVARKRVSSERVFKGSTFEGLAKISGYLSNIIDKKGKNKYETWTEQLQAFHKELMSSSSRKDSDHELRRQRIHVHVEALFAAVKALGVDGLRMYWHKSVRELEKAATFRTKWRELNYVAIDGNHEREEL